MALVSAVAVILVLAIAGCDDDGGPKTIDLHQVDWANVTVPPSVCGAKRPIQLHGGHAVVVSTRWGRSWRDRSRPARPRVTVSSGWNPVVYGDLDGDGADEAALIVNCNNGGGMAGGVLAYAQVIFTPAEKSPRVIGVVTPQQRPNPHVNPTIVVVTIRRDEVIAREAWYGAHDGTCCPSGRSTTVWTMRDGRLRPVKTVVVRPPEQ